MPRYFLHLHNGVGFTSDEEGQDLADAQGAVDEAIRSIRSLLADELVAGEVNLDGRIEIRDSANKLVVVVPFAEAVRIRGQTG